MNVEIIVVIKSPLHTQYPHQPKILSGFNLPEPVGDNIEVKKAQQCKYVLPQLRTLILPHIRYSSTQWVLCLCTSIAVWFVSATKSEENWLQQTVKTAETIISEPLPALVTSEVRKRQAKSSETHRLLLLQAIFLKNSYHFPIRFLKSI